jgi:hypothetical protein
MSVRTARVIMVFVLLVVLAAVWGCYVPFNYWNAMRLPIPMRSEMKALGPMHIWVPETVLYINENCELVDESGSPVTDLALIRGGKVTIWNKSGAIAYVDFGEAFAPPGDVRLNPDWGVWRRVALEAPTSGFEVKVTCEALGETMITPYALPDTVVTPPPKP